MLQVEEQQLKLQVCMVEEQEKRLLEMGFCVKNTFLDGASPPSALDCLDRRAKSDPTSSRSSSQSSSQTSSQSPRSSHQPESMEDKLMNLKENLSLTSEDWKRLEEYAFGNVSDLIDTLAQIPVEGYRLTSLGSKAHAAGRCRPCLYFVKAGHQMAEDVGSSCVEGILCRFCHFEHDATKKIRMRPSLSRRNQMWKLLKAMEHEAEGNLSAEDIVRLPPWIKDKPIMLEKFRARLREARVSGTRCASSATASCSSTHSDAGPRAGASSKIAL
mmetsp:Transcript_141491/g.368656  ORF Transcript_141491/g.368656 Transcript_141491/m.368656 type:complete len:272 (+) Transcript_141491:50-865(+)